jgi:hypothetical protein
MGGWPNGKALDFGKGNSRGFLKKLQVRSLRRSIIFCTPFLGRVASLHHVHRLSSKYELVSRACLAHLIYVSLNSIEE